ncbi:MAG TPA: SBBP repeat-containing protein, partial [Pyrinomonadaceae bacterium]|nr:SBBP repeat-containing protein [Pyrinomonadaceae bacterium]
MPTSCSRRQSSHFLLTLALTLSLAAGSWPRPQRAADPPAKVPTQTSAETEQRAKEAYGKLGVRFEENRGQSDERVRFISRGGGATVFLANDEATFVLSAREALARRERPKTHTVHMKFEGANPAAEVSGERELEGKFNHFRSSDPSKWQTKVKTYGAVRYRGIYDGVDLVYYGNAQGRMEYDFEVAPGADANQISLKIEGAKAVEVDAAGDLVISTPVGPLKQHKPSVYQEVGGERCAVEGRYAVEAGGRVRFNLGQYDQSAPLVIDPVLSSFFLGDENFGDEPQGIATDSSGNVYITGFILVFDLTGASNTVAFVAKYKPSSGDLIFFTDLFAADKDEPYDIAADSSGNAYVAGYTNDPDGFPVVNPYQSTNAGGNDAFLAKLNLDGSEIIYATYLGGSGDDRGVELAVDSAGQVCVTGSTTSDDFPVANAIQGTRLSSTDYFVTKFNAAGSALIYSTYLDGNKYNVTAIAADPAGNAYLTGATSATDFPVVNAFQSTNAGGRDAFVAKLNAAGSAFIYSSYLGGSGDDSASDIALDSSRRAYVTGETYSTDFPAVNAFQSTNGGGRDAFVARLKADGSALVFSTYLGGSGSDNSIGIGVDSWGHATVGGQTNSTDFPLKSPIPGMDVGIVDAYAARIKANGSALLYSTYVGTENEDTVGGVTADQSGNAYLAANTINENEEEEGDNAFGGDPHDVLLMKLIVTPF